MLILQLNLNK